MALSGAVIDTMQRESRGRERVSSSRRSWYSPAAPRDVAIVVPVGGPARAWPRAARSLARLEPPPGEIVVVIDGRHDAVAAVAVEIGATVLVLDERSGPARARNRGARVAIGDILLFVDADVEVTSDLAARVVGILTAHPDIAAVFGSYDDAPADGGLVSQYRNLLHHFVHQTGRQEASTFWAGCGAVRREAFCEVGGFDEGRAVPSIEDIELGSRLLRAGHTIRLEKSLQVKHLKAWRFTDMVATDLWRRAVPWTELMLRDGRLVNDLNVSVRERASVLVAFVAVLALAGSPRWPRLLGAGGAALLLMVALNAGFFEFLGRRRGAVFAAAAIPLHVTYLLVCGFGFGVGVIRHLVGRRR